ncbi:MAG: hypothetical protein ACI9FN_001564 [Saprospiraceae bacterium]|jgi:hypothetical protein
MDSLFAVQLTPANAILTEEERIRSEDADFLNDLPRIVMCAGSFQAEN